MKTDAIPLVVIKKITCYEIKTLEDKSQLQWSGTDTIRTKLCYEMDKTSIFMFEILEPGGSALGKYSI